MSKTVTPHATPSSQRHVSTTGAVVRCGFGLGLLLVVPAALGHWFGDELKLMSHWFVERVGLPGMAFGTWLADAFNFPIPPQAYMLIAAASGTPAINAWLFIAVGSILGGLTGYRLGPYLLRIRFVPEAVQGTRSKARWLSGEHWFLGVLLLSLTPVAFSWLCYAAALYRVPKRALALLCVLRLPKLAVYQALVNVGFGGFAGLP